MKPQSNRAGWRCRRVGLLLGLAAACGLGSGCSRTFWDGTWLWGKPLIGAAPTPTSKENLTDLAQRTAPTGIPNQIHADEAHLRIRVYQMSMPLGTFSLNDKIWRQLDEDALDSATSVLLAQNGLRAAVGRQDRWPAVAKLLDGPGTRTQEYVCLSDGRSAIQITTRPNLPEQTVFYVDRDLELQGRTFARCDNAVRLSMASLKDTTDMLVQLEPLVITGTVEISRNGSDLGITRQSRPQEETFRNLRLQSRVAAKDFLVLAPLNPKGNAFSVGTRFLSNADTVPPMETILVFVPLPKQ
ncbi:MAG: hypothetical protein WCI73_01310 [Phycisphaerae bacterium]